MAFPVVAGHVTSNDPTTVTTHTLALPSTISAGDLLIAYFTIRDSGTIDWPAGWTDLFSAISTSQSEASYRVADGAEGATISITSSLSRRSAHQCFRITGHNAAQAPEAATATGSSTQANPPVVTPTGGAKDYLWLVSAGEHGGQSITVYPTDYTDGTEKGTDATGAGHVLVGTARRELNATSEDPDTFTTGASAIPWVAATLAVHPAVEGTEPAPTLRTVRSNLRLA